jgi:ribosomal protein S12 methylthiotransferase accessory factor
MQANVLSQDVVSVAKGFRDGTHRTVSPEETLERVGRFMPVMGITRIANVTGLDRVGLPVVMVVRPNSRSLSVSQGKGMCLAAAKASGLMESIEAYHAERVGLPLRLASLEQLKYAHKIVDVEALPQTAQARFHPHLRLLWDEGYDLLHDEVVLVPHEMVHADYTTPFPPGSGCFIATTNGLASGNHLLEAISHGICEVVERDGVSLAYMDDKSRRARRIDLESVDHPDYVAVLDKLWRLICLSV